MDFTDKFCMMCEKAIELKAFEKTYSNTKSIYVSKENGKFIPEHRILGKHQFWLITEEELKSILSIKDESLNQEHSYVIFLKSNYLKDKNSIVLNYFNSFEQYLLAFFMLNHANKKWIENSWRSENIY